MGSNRERSAAATVHFDCRHFLGDRPCTFHKVEGVKCADCPHHDPVTTRILIVKLGAMGDVLRTTSILPSLVKQYERPHITWITAKASVDLLRHHETIDTLLVYDSQGLARLMVEQFDVVINPEASTESAALASLARGTVKRGFGLSPQGHIVTLNDDAEELLHLGLFDDLKKQNTRTYEELICRLCAVPYERVSPVLRLTDDERAFADAFRVRAGLAHDKPVVGLNTGGGTRWRLKRWRIDGFAELAERLVTEQGAQILLLGGPAEKELNEQILARVSRGVVDTGSSNTPRQFAGIVNLCDVVVTGDSLAMHIGVALRKQMVVLFGPTSSTEIDLYDRGSKIIPDMDCLSCYLQTCDKSPNCMDNIAVETVHRAVADHLAAVTVPGGKSEVES